MATPGGGGFDVWLTDTLKSISSDIDTDIFVTYIIGILDTDSQEEENEENITELLSGVIEPDTAKNVCRSIITQWDVDCASKKVSQVSEDVADKLSMIFEKQTLATVTEKKLSKEEADRKAAILAQYGQVSDGEDDTEELSADDSSTPSIVSASAGGVAKVKGDMRDTSDSLLVRNVNKEDVLRLDREKREKAKEEQEKKKEKDKQDRLAQKQKQQERKETEKKRTQKGEKRR